MSASTGIGITPARRGAGAGGIVPSGIALRSREYVVGLLDRDSARDEAQHGEQPLSDADYRRALYAVLAAVTPDVLAASCGSVVTGSEVTAYELGRRALADAVLVGIARAWSADRLVSRTDVLPARGDSGSQP